MSTQELYLFRYRNLLTENTLDEHCKIIDAHGHCWWGWWRRPAEDAWVDIWRELDKRTQAGEPVRIGLFNSEPGRQGPVHFATVTKIMGPRDDNRAPALTADESALVPSYYREAPFSSAWMRLEAIEKAPIEPFFGRYSFARAPRLTGISTYDRDRYVNKLIRDADELHSMDTTIWVVRPKIKSDHEERILAASAKVTDSLSSRPIELRSARILHLSDLHFTTSEFKRDEHNWNLIGEGESTLAARIVDALEPDSEKIGLVVISGDLTYWASEAEFYEAFRFVHALLGALRLGSEHLVVVPGNHDLLWTKQKGEKWSPGLSVTEAPETARRCYREKFYERVFRHAAAPHLGMARRFVSPNGLSVEMGGLNSSSLEQGPSWFAGMGRVEDGAFEEIAKTFGWAPSSPSLALRVLVHHHHLGPTEDVLPLGEYEHGFGMASDAKKTLRNAARHGVQLVLHGHRHQPYIGAEQVYAELERTENPWALGRVGLIGAGSAGSTSVHGGENWFNIIDLHTSRLDLAMYRAVTSNHSRGAFRAVHHWTASLNTDAGRLLLGDWERRSKG
jgi:3',5'-cyclic AMP phosphodiesterase CpdA